MMTDFSFLGGVSL